MASKKGQPRRYTIDFVRDYLDSFGYELLSEDYTNIRTKLLIKCPNNHKYQTHFAKFKINNKRCHSCFTDNNRGENHYKWNDERIPNKHCDRLRMPKNRSWIIKHMKHDVNYNNYINTLQPNKKAEYQLDHIIPVKIFYLICKQYDIPHEQVKYAVNSVDNYQLIHYKENCSKSDSGSIEEGIEYLKNKGVFDYGYMDRN